MTDANWTRIKNHLVATGRMTEEGYTRKVQARGCKTCHGPVLAALDADVCALALVLDPTPLSALGEAMAVLTGRSTRALRYVGGRYELSARDPLIIRGSPAGTKPYDVLAAHRCDTPPLSSAPSAFTAHDHPNLPPGAPAPF